MIPKKKPPSGSRGKTPSKKEDWETPPDLFQALNKTFNFTLDACASDDHHLCRSYYTKHNSALNHFWKGRVFCNPPYGKKYPEFVKHGAQSVIVEKTADVAVFVIPFVPETKLYQDFIFKFANAVCFIRTRLRFYDKGVVSTGTPPAPVSIVIFGPVGVYDLATIAFNYGKKNHLRYWLHQPGSISPGCAFLDINAPALSLTKASTEWQEFFGP